eukprot:GHVU01216423.1.p1 GENE.GHVU01216423.1~~GHVU01216423.1.p1  ORF type:complete len:116 (-),score=4.37 GHVU01216423.1:852-1199(-)
MLLPELSAIPTDSLGCPRVEPTSIMRREGGEEGIPKWEDARLEQYKEEPNDADSITEHGHMLTHCGFNAFRDRRLGDEGYIGLLPFFKSPAPPVLLEAVHYLTLFFCGKSVFQSR